MVGKTCAFFVEDVCALALLIEVKAIGCDVQAIGGKVIALFHAIGKTPKTGVGTNEVLQIGKYSFAARCKTCTVEGTGVQHIGLFCK
ncbi:hypothetical protein M4Q70_19575 [Acidovorax valerianellae]|nr:hypothetical protein [Paracidovorax valerianellae]